MLGQRTVSELTQKQTWGFESKVMARDYLLLCLILTVAPADYFLKLQQKALKQLRQKISVVKEFSKKDKQVDKIRSDKYFVVAFDNPKKSLGCSNMPYFYVIGNNQNAMRASHQRWNNKAICHDFCIAMGDLQYYRANYATKSSETPGTKSKKRKDSGRAIFFRPLCSDLSR